MILSRKLSLLLLVLLAGCSRSVAVEEIQVENASPGELAEDYQPNANDWPGWRGPTGQGIADSVAPPLEWSETDSIAWRTPVPGRGHGSPVVVGDRVFLNTAEEAEERNLMVAFDRSTGAELWRVTLNEGGFPPASQVHQKGTDANSTIACDEKHAYVAHLVEGSIIASAVTHTGEIAWQTTLGAFASKFGYAPSPVVYGPYVLFAADNWGGGYLTAVDRSTGKIAWRKKRSSTSTYSSPIVAKVSGRDQLLISGDDQICSYDPLTGESLWSCRGASEATCGTLVWNDDTVFASGGYPDQQTLAVRADGSAEILWTNQVKVYEPSLLVVGSEVYATNDRGMAYCWDSQTGEQRWRQRVGGSFSASPVYCDGKIYALKASGEMIVFKATPDGYEELASNQLGEEAFASPALCDGSLFLRVGQWKDDTRQEYLYRVASKDSTTNP